MRNKQIISDFERLALSADFLLIYWLASYKIRFVAS
jgi:hypothetical protein